ncbi:F-box only protein 16 isoform X2 [Anarrhichthys ocellatus]|nr:F-box only protein 16 isoform X2 [Anarrhichthys ocellatus]
MPLGARVPPRSSASCAKMKTTRSTWTPLNHPVSNSKVFEERRNLLAKWFDRWSDGQRKAVLQDLVLSCSVEQLSFLSVSVSTRLPLQAADLSCLLPRALCLYLFSFLDPRSLCRCARVSWHWRSIVELDQLWMPKCVRLGWCISFSPGPLEQGVWKRHYIQTVQELQLTSLQVGRSDPEPAHRSHIKYYGSGQTLMQNRAMLQCNVHLQATSSQQQYVVPHVSAVSRRREDPSGPAFMGEEPSAPITPSAGGISRTGSRGEKQPWRDSDRRPTDTLRFNYLDNLDPSEEALRAAVNSGASARRSNAWRPGDGSQRTLSEAHYKLRKAKSLMFLSSNCRPQHPPLPPPPLPPPLHHPALPPPLHHPALHHPPETQSRPSWASHSLDLPVTKETAMGMLRLTRWNAGIRPGPVRSAVPRLSVEALRASRRSHRSAPTTPLSWTGSAPHTHQQDVRTTASGPDSQPQLYSRKV